MFGKQSEDAMAPTCTLAMSLLYAGSVCVTQYSKGLLFTAAMFHVVARNCPLNTNKGHDS